MAHITELLQRWPADKDARDEVCRLLFDELRKVARAYLAQERSGHTLQPTALVNEAVLRLLQQDERIVWSDRKHFLGILSKLMRQVLVDYARKKNSVKRGGGIPHVPIEECDCISEDQADELILIDEWLEKLAKWDPLQAKIVERCFFGGGDFQTVAESLRETDNLEITPDEVEKQFKLARAWIFRESRRKRP